MDVTYMLVGAFASSAYGEPRTTRDIDVVVKLESGDIAVLCRAFPPSDYYLSSEAAQDAVRHGGQFNVIHGASGHKIDFMIARTDDWGRHQIARRQRVAVLPGLLSYSASAEDVMLGKMIYYQESRHSRHLNDIDAIMTVSGDQIDRAYVTHWAEQLGVADLWRDILSQTGG